MKCYNCGNDLNPYQQIVGNEKHGFCPICNCNLTLQHKFVQITKQALNDAEAYRLKKARLLKRD